MFKISLLLVSVLFMTFSHASEEKELNASWNLNISEQKIADILIREYKADTLTVKPIHYYTFDNMMNAIRFGISKGHQRIQHVFTIRDNAFASDCLLLTNKHANTAWFWKCKLTITKDAGEAEEIKKGLYSGFILDLSEILAD